MPLVSRKDDVTQVLEFFKFPNRPLSFKSLLLNSSLKIALSFSLLTQYILLEEI